jgi:hypothetical protein
MPYSMSQHRCQINNAFFWGGLENPTNKYCIIRIFCQVGFLGQSGVLYRWCDGWFSGFLGSSKGTQKTNGFGFRFSTPL